MNQIEQYQASLIVKFVSAARRARPECREFVFHRTPPHDRPSFGAGFREPFEVDKTDLDALADLGLITERSYIHSMGTVVVTQAAFELYDEWLRQPSPPKGIGLPSRRRTTGD